MRGLTFPATILRSVLYYQLDGPPAPREIGALDIANRRIALTEGLRVGCARAYVSTVLLSSAEVIHGPAHDLPFEVALRRAEQLGNMMQVRYPTREAALVGHERMVEYAHLLQRMRIRARRRRYYRSRGRNLGSCRRATRHDANRLIVLLGMMFKEQADVDL